MKKNIFWLTLMLSIFSSSLFAQLKVDDYGRVGIATTSTNSIFSVGSPGLSTYTASINPIGTRSGLYISNHVAEGNTSPMGIYVFNQLSNSLSSSYGLRINTTTIRLTSGDVYGVFAKSGSSTSKSIGVYGAVGDTLAPYSTGIYGSSTTSTAIAHRGNFAGYFNGDVIVTGTAFIRTFTPLTNRSNSKNTIILSEDALGERITDKLSQLQTLQVNNGNDLQEQKVSDSDIKVAEECEEELAKSIVPVQAKVSGIHYSVEEQSIRDIFPEMVYEDKDGNVSVNYVEMVPLLVQSIKELKAEIEELKGNDVKKVASRNTMATSIEGTDAEAYILYQNEPNPFKEATTVKLTIPKKAQDVALIIYDMSGKQLKQININDRGKTSVKITSEGLGAGMYLYSLIADGKVINTKRMILTK